MSLMVESLDARELEEFQEFEGELEGLKREFLSIKKESFKANPSLKSEINRLGFYNGDESGENINFNIDNVRKYLETIKNKSWSDLDVKSTELEKGVRTIAIQLAINYINMKKGGVTNNINLIDGIRGDQTWRGVKEFQTTYGLKNKDGLPGHETITKTLELLPSDEGVSNSHNDVIGSSILDHIDNDTGEMEEYIEKSDFLESRLSYNSIDNNKCLNLFKNLKIGGVNNGGRRINRRSLDFDNKLKNKFTDVGKIEAIIFQNPEIGNLLSTIVSHQSKEIENMKSRHISKKPLDKNKATKETNETLDENNETIVQSWEDYKFENASLNSFEEFILSEEGLAIIIDEIKSHIDTSHKNENGEYVRFKEKSPFSLINLEARLRNAREDRMHWDYYEKNVSHEDLEELAKMHILSNKITLYVDKLVGNSTTFGNEIFSQDMIAALEGFLSKGIYGVSLIEMFSGKEAEQLRDIFEGVLSDSIKTYEGEVRNEKDEFILEMKDKQAELQLKSYLYLYGRIFHTQHFKANKGPEYYEDILPEIMKIIISNDDTSLINKIKHKEFLEVQRKQEEERKKRDLKKRQEATKKIRERNERLKSTQIIDKQGNIGEIQTKSTNPDTATGPELAAEANLGKDLDDYELDIEESEEIQQWEKETIFNDAWKDFIQSHDSVKSLITREDMRRLFDINNNTINIQQWENFTRSNPILKDIPSDKLEQIRVTLSGFSSYFNEAEKRLSADSSDMKVKVNETVKTYAIGAVIDNVRDTFDVITQGQSGNFSGFQLDRENPVKKEGDDIIISGFFNGSNINVRYDLRTGELFMNSFLSQLSPNKVSISKDGAINEPIGTIKPFNDVLNDYYKLPTQSENGVNKNVGPQMAQRPEIDPAAHPRRPHDEIDSKNNPPVNNKQQPRQMGRPMGMPIGPQIPKIDENNLDSRRQEVEQLLGSQLSLIGEAIKNNTESQAQRSSAIMGFLKTFNIISDFGQFNSWDFNRGSNLFDVIDIIQKTGDIESGDIQSLSYFNTEFMPKVMEYSGLKWGKRNESQDKKNEKSEKIYNYDGDNENIKSLRDKTKDFNPKQFSGLANFEDTHQLGFADLIKEKLITGEESNRKLDITKMRDFLRDLETVDKEVDTQLDKQLASID